MPHSYAMYGYVGYAKFGYATWLRHVRLRHRLRQTRLHHMWLRQLRHGYAKFGYATWLRRLRQTRLCHIATLHTELRHCASLRHPASLLASLHDVTT